MRGVEQRAVAADADDKIGRSQLALERGVEGNDRTLGESYPAGFERPPRRVNGAFVLAVGMEQSLGRLVAFAGKSGRAPALRHRGLLDDDQTVVYLHRRCRSPNQPQ